MNVDSVHGIDAPCGTQRRRVLTSMVSIVLEPEAVKPRETVEASTPREAAIAAIACAWPVESDLHAALSPVDAVAV